MSQRIGWALATTFIAGYRNRYTAGPKLLEQLEAEMNRYRETLESRWDKEDDERVALARATKLLTRVAAALNGRQGSARGDTWSDLPRLVKELKATVSTDPKRVRGPSTYPNHINFAVTPGTRSLGLSMWFLTETIVKHKTWNKGAITDLKGLRAGIDQVIKKLEARR